MLLPKMRFAKTDPMRRDCMNWNSIYMTSQGYPAPPVFAVPRGKQGRYAEPANVKEAEKMQLEEALEQVLAYGLQPTSLFVQAAACILDICSGIDF